MPEKISVEGFAGIRHLELELARINVLIGPQATGKSVVAKLLYYFKNFTSALTEGAALARAWSDLEEILSSRFKSYFPPSSWSSKASSVRFDAGDIYIELHTKGKSVELDCSPILKHTYDHSVRVHGELLAQSSGGDLLKMARVRTEISMAFLRQIYGTGALPKVQQFIPASRSFFAHLKGNIFTYLSGGDLRIDPFIMQFGAFYEQFKPSLLEIQESGDEDVTELLERILEGRYEMSTDEDEYLRHADGRRIHVADASSGQQEVLPLAIVLAHLLTDREKRWSRGMTTYIEEPEAHLFPTAQRDVVHLIATAFNRSKIQFFITTHSPYILTTLNNLLEAGRLYSTLEGDKLERLRQVIPEERALHPSDIAAYVLEAGGARSIFDDEYQLIADHEIDSVSDDLGLEFDRLLDLEPEKA